jgi:HAMP domain-containing protein
MKRRAVRLALAAAIGLITLSLLAGAAAGHSGGSTGPAGPLTHRFPLGTQTLSHTTSAPARGPATTPHRRSAPTPRGASAAASHRRGTAQAVHKHGAHGAGSLLFLLALPVLIVVALLSRRAIRRSRRPVPPRARVRHRAARITPSTLPGARWAFEDKDELERMPPSLPIRPRGE